MTLGKIPTGLGDGGAALWRDVLERFELRPDEERMLLAACKTTDELDRLERALAEAEVTTTGSKGQVRGHPLLGEVRAHRLTLRQLLVAVGLDEGTADERGSRSHAARQLAHRRWRRNYVGAA